jgi:hypothetical protein
MSQPNALPEAKQHRHHVANRLGGREHPGGLLLRQMRDPNDEAAYVHCVMSTPRYMDERAWRVQIASLCWTLLRPNEAASQGPAKSTLAARDFRIETTDS